MMRFIPTTFYLTALTLLVACSDQSAMPEAGSELVADKAIELSELQARLNALQARAGRIKDSNDIKRLQRAYGYYLDEALWDELVDLFTEDATVEYARDGLYRGKNRIRDYLYVLGGGQQGLNEGQLNEHYQLMPVITLAEDGLSAKGRWRAIILNGDFGEVAMWGEGPYENEYVKQEGVWKISKVRWYQTILVPYEGGWGLNEDVNKGIYVSSEFPPDVSQTDDFGSWPETFLPPFHFDNPVGRYESPTSGTEGEGL
ncbi:MAG: nuclear transport factor 2 family protein [Gammaproteobacteria bacterium]|nr:nuclear transport factor 2 family protein [Gammaproteobacteria bacterium]